MPQPRQEYIDAFDDDVFAAGAPGAADAAKPKRPASGGDGPAGRGAGPAAPVGPTDPDGPSEPLGPDGGDVGARRAAKGGLSRTFTGVAAAAVTTVLAVVVAGQVAHPARGGISQAAGGVPREDEKDASRSEHRPTPDPAESAAAPATYEQKMAAKYPLAPTLKGSGAFRAVPGHDTAPGKGQVLRYRVEVEKGLGLDGELFAEAVHKTLNDDRSWGHGGTRTFERISAGKADFVITLASPGTTAEWCAKSGLDTTEDNVSCDSAATERVMINAYRWAQGSKTYGDRMFAYRQMLINHEVGHRLGRNHEGCPRSGALAPVMMQQTKFLTTGGATCKPNPWPFPSTR